MLTLVIVVVMGAFSLACVVGPRMHAFAGLAGDFSVKVSCDAFGAGLVGCDYNRVDGAGLKRRVDRSGGGFPMLNLSLFNGHILIFAKII